MLKLSVPEVFMDKTLLISPQYEALRRVHLIPAEGTAEEDPETVNANVFRNLESPVSEGGENFSTGSVQTLYFAFVCDLT